MRLMSNTVAGARIDGVYRYSLWRSWSGEDSLSRTMGFIMLNPSTADGLTDDPTIRRCIGFARRENCTGIAVVNLFAYRATSPGDLVEASDAGVDPVGPENDWHIADLMFNAACNATPVVAAWGTKGAPGRCDYVRREAAVNGVKLRCLGTTKAGHPRHPLYVRGDQPLIAYEATS